MADIELVIKVPECFYEYCKAQTAPIEIELAVAKGIPLPKGHGRLKDIDKIISDGISKGFCDWYDEMKYASTIVEADK